MNSYRIVRARIFPRPGTEALDEAHKEKILKSVNGRAKPEITRFKGLGEMMTKVLWETTLDPKTRRLLRVESRQSCVGHRMRHGPSVGA